MRAIVQRVSQCEVKVDCEITPAKSNLLTNEQTIGSEMSCHSQISFGLLIYVAVAKEDEQKDVVYLADKIAGLRVFDDDSGRMNESVSDRNGEVMIVSQFTLYGDVRRGRRPSFNRVAEPNHACKLYKELIRRLQIDYGIRVASGKFQSHMNVHSTNSGPVTILLDSTQKF